MAVRNEQSAISRQVGHLSIDVVDHGLELVSQLR
jgi:hypothetical protein